MIIKKNDDRNLLPTDVIGSSVARSKRWLVAIVRICHEKKTGEAYENGDRKFPSNSTRSPSMERPP